MSTTKTSKDQLLSKLSSATTFKKKDCEVFLAALCNLVIDEVKKGSDVAFGTIGTFKYRKSKARTCKVIKTGVPIQVPARGGATFRISKKTRDMLASVLL